MNVPVKYNGKYNVRETETLSLAEAFYVNRRPVYAWSTWSISNVLTGIAALSTSAEDWYDPHVGAIPILCVFVWFALLMSLCFTCTSGYLPSKKRVRVEKAKNSRGCRRKRTSISATPDGEFVKVVMARNESPAPFWPFIGSPEPALIESKLFHAENEDEKAHAFVSQLRENSKQLEAGPTATSEARALAAALNK